METCACGHPERTDLHHDKALCISRGWIGSDVFRDVTGKDDDRG